MSLLLLTACTGGTKFTRPSDTELRLGVTTEQDVRQRMGEPTQAGTIQKNGETMTSLVYGYALAMPYVDDVKTRGMGFHFAKGVLVGYDFTSSFPEDMSRFDETKVPQIQRGQTTRPEVVALLGQPGGMYAFPMIKDQAGTALVYLFVDSNRHPFGATVRHKRKLLIVSFDAQGVVTDVDYFASDPT